MTRGSAVDLDGVCIRLLAPGEAGRLTEAIRAAYGDSYDAGWVYDEHEIARRLSDGVLVSAIAESETEGLLCHAAMTLTTPRDRVGHVGQAVTLPAARGHHLFTAVKRFLVHLAGQRKMYGLYSEATAAHPYSQRANVDLGAHETGFLLGWIPGEVRNDAATGPGTSARQSAALFYLRTRPGPARPAYVPARHRRVVHDTITVSGLHARLSDPPSSLRPERRSTVHTHHVERHNMALATVVNPGEDLPRVLAALRNRLFAAGIDCLYVDVPLDHHASAVVAEELPELGLCYAGLFPSPIGAGPMLRLQSLNGVLIDPGGLEVVTDHGRALLAYVLDDLAAAGHEVVAEGERAAGPQ